LRTRFGRSGLDASDCETERARQEQQDLRPRNPPPHPPSAPRLVPPLPRCGRGAQKPVAQSPSPAPREGVPTPGSQSGRKRVRVPNGGNRRVGLPYIAPASGGVLPGGCRCLVPAHSMAGPESAGRPESSRAQSPLERSSPETRSAERCGGCCCRAAVEVADQPRRIIPGGIDQGIEIRVIHCGQYRLRQTATALLRDDAARVVLRGTKPTVIGAVALDP